MSQDDEIWRDRPYFHDSAQQLLARYHDNSDDLVELKTIAYELQFRKAIGESKKEEIFENLIGIYERKIASQNLLLKYFARKSFRAPTGDGTPQSTPVPDKPDIDFDPSVEESRRKNRPSENTGWREIGLLKASGYGVGKTNGISEARRRKILRHIFLLDELTDVDDPDYVLEWGDPKTGDRLKKMVDSIVTFTKNAKRKSGTSYTVAISEWESDLAYLKATFYDRWGDFPWPDVEP